MINKQIELKEVGVTFDVNFGEAEGVQAGYKEGYKDGEAEGYSKGEAEGRTEGYQEGYDKGEAAGQAKGYQEGHTAGYTEGYGEGETAGHIAGYTEGYDKGEADGNAAGQAQGEREIWDSLTNNGTRKNYEKFFVGAGFEYIRPPYVLRPTSSLTLAQTFQDATNLKKIEASAFDFSQKTRGTYAGAGLYYTFNGCLVLEEIEDIGLQPDFAMYSTFAWATKLRIIVRLAVDANTIYDNPFLGCYALEYITFDGVIGQNGLDFSYCSKLSKASWQNVVGCLSATATGRSITGSLASVKKAFETAPGANDGNTSDEWLALTATKPNWTISLA